MCGSIARWSNYHIFSEVEAIIFCLNIKFLASLSPSALYSAFCIHIYGVCQVWDLMNLPNAFMLCSETEYRTFPLATRFPLGHFSPWLSQGHSPFLNRTFFSRLSLRLEQIKYWPCSVGSVVCVNQFWYYHQKIIVTMDVTQSRVYF